MRPRLRQRRRHRQRGATARQNGVNTLNGSPALVATAEGSCSRCPGWLAVATPAAASAASTAASRAIQSGA